MYLCIPCLQNVLQVTANTNTLHRFTCIAKWHDFMHKYYKELTAVMWVQVKLWEVLPAMYKQTMTILSWNS
jgi:hypothetical protein